MNVRDIIFQILLTLVGLVISSVTPLLPKLYQQWIASILALLLIGGASGWAGYELGSNNNKDWPPKLISYYSFETDDIQEWGENVKISNKHAFAGRRSLEVRLPIVTSKELAEKWLEWEHKIMADAIVGQIYWPQSPGVEIVFAQVCIPFNNQFPCEDIPVNQGGWSTFTVNLSDVDEPSRKLDQVNLSKLVFQGKLVGAKAGTMSIYLDSIQLIGQLIH